MKLNTKVIYDLLTYGITVLYLPDYGIYIAHTSSKFYNPSNQIFDITIEGKDITVMIENAGTMMLDKFTVETNLEKLKSRKFVFDASTHYIWFK
jgi:hypothetical protein